MNPNFKLNLLTLSLLAITSIAHAEDEVSTQELDEIQVKGKYIAKEKKVFTEGQAKSSRERVYQSSENIDAIVRSMPGVFTQQDKGSGVLAVNIRGDSGLGRVNTMVDGVTQ
ncbi:TonB-dependent receptor plug domain-containing protein, partial [Neisseria sicca]